MNNKQISFLVFLKNNGFEFINEADVYQYTHESKLVEDSHAHHRHPESGMLVFSTLKLLFFYQITIIHEDKVIAKKVSIKRAGDLIYQTLTTLN